MNNSVSLAKRSTFSARHKRQNSIKYENILKNEWTKSVHDFDPMDKKCPFVKIFEDFLKEVGRFTVTFGE
jgi:hypothetical protein